MLFRTKFKSAFAALMSVVFSVTNSLAQGVVINELDVYADEPFVELFGLPEFGLEGYTLVLAKAQFLGGGLYEAQIYETVDLADAALNSEGFIDFELPLNTTIAAVALYEVEATELAIGTPPPSDDIVDAIVYGNTSPGAPQAAALLQALMPPSSDLIYEGSEGNA